MARTGAERDGVNAVFDMRDPSRAYAARRDLPLAARTESQTAALRALVGVPTWATRRPSPEAYRPTRIAQAREAVKRFALGEVPSGVAGTGDTAEAERQAEERRPGRLPGSGRRRGRASTRSPQAATDEAFRTTWPPCAVEPLADKASTDRAAAALLAYATAKAVTPAEEAALSGVGNLIRPPAWGSTWTPRSTPRRTNLLTPSSTRRPCRRPPSRRPAATRPGRRPGRSPTCSTTSTAGGTRTRPRPPTGRPGTSRVATVVGLPEYIRAAEAEASEYAEAAQRLTAVITEEQSAFEAEYHAQLQRVLFLYSQWLALDAQLKAQDVITKENVRLMNERKTERDNLLKELAKAREDAKATLAKLNKTQTDLFAIQKDLRDAQEALLVLEKQLRTLEFDAQKYDDQATWR